MARKKTLRQLLRDADDTLNIVTGHRVPWWGKFIRDNFGPLKDVLQDTQSDDDPYRVLGLHSGASMRVVKAAHRALAFEHHPDHGGDPQQFKRVQEAYERVCKERG